MQGRVWDYEKFKKDWYDYTLRKFFKYADIPDEGGCWEWRGTIMPDLKTQIKIGQVIISAQRASYMLFKENIPAGMNVYKTCGNPFCVNPEHLYLDKSGKIINAHK